MPETVLSKPENATFKSSPYMSATKNVKLGSAFGLEVIAARGLMIARLTGFRDQVIVPAGACPEATAGGIDCEDSKRCCNVSRHGCCYGSSIKRRFHRFFLPHAWLLKLKPMTVDSVSCLSFFPPFPGMMARHHQDGLPFWA